MTYKVTIQSRGLGVPVVMATHHGLDQSTAFALKREHRNDPYTVAVVQVECA